MVPIALVFDNQMFKVLKHIDFFRNMDSRFGVLEKQCCFYQYETKKNRHMAGVQKIK